MYPLHCPQCGRWLAHSCSIRHGNAISDWDECWGICKVHGPQHWSEY